jgi:hypothetical protein
MKRSAAGDAVALSVQARAATYYVIVAGLGGEPDYEQRFTASGKRSGQGYSRALGRARACLR